MKLLLRATTAICLTFQFWGVKPKKKPLNKSLKVIGMHNNDPLEDYYNSIGNHGEYLTRCPNCGLYTSGYYCSVDCEDDYRIAFS